jgi:hypothetical protein
MNLWPRTSRARPALGADSLDDAEGLRGPAQSREILSPCEADRQSFVHCIDENTWWRLLVT